MLIAGMLLMLAQAAPTAETVALGERLARAGTLAALLPLMAEKETGEMIAAHPELSAADQAALRRTAATTLATASAKLFAAEGRRYAELLSPAELAELVAAAERPAARRLRTVQPQVIAATMAAMDGFDFKRDTMAAFCAQARQSNGKTCPK